MVLGSAGWSRWCRSWSDRSVRRRPGSTRWARSARWRGLGRRRLLLGGRAPVADGDRVALLERAARDRRRRRCPPPRRRGCRARRAATLQPEVLELRARPRRPDGRRSRPRPPRPVSSAVGWSCGSLLGRRRDGRRARVGGSGSSSPLPASSTIATIGRDHGQREQQPEPRTGSCAASAGPARGGGGRGRGAGHRRRCPSPGWRPCRAPARPPPAGPRSPGRAARRRTPGRRRTAPRETSPSPGGRRPPGRPGRRRAARAPARAGGPARWRRRSRRRTAGGRPGTRRRRRRASRRRRPGWRSRPAPARGRGTAGCPSPAPVSVSDMPSAARAMPKSVIFTCAVGRDQQVGGLHVAVHDPGRVRGTERVGGLGEQVAGGVGVQRLPGPEQRRQRLAVDQLHHQVGPGHPGPVGGRGLAEVVDGRHARVVQGGGVPGLGLEPGAERRVVGVLGLEQLDRDLRGRARCRWRATPRPCRRSRSGSRARSGGRRRRSCSGVRWLTGSPPPSRSWRSGRRAAPPAISPRGMSAPSGSSPPPRPAGRRRARTRRTRRTAGPRRTAALGGAGLAGRRRRPGSRPGWRCRWSTVETISSVSSSAVDAETACGELLRLGLVEDVELGRADLVDEVGPHHDAAVGDRRPPPSPSAAAWR